jgi:creatinine amidohydrolase
MASSVMWKELTAEDIGGLARAGAVAILPVASMEQHGPHLPVGVDTILCEGVCRAAAERIRHQTPVVVAPTLWCGMAEHTAFGGTFTFDISTYRPVRRSLPEKHRAGRLQAGRHRQRPRRQRLGAQRVLPDLACETSVDLVATTYSSWRCRRSAASSRTRTVLHACELETSLMMVLAPGTVKHDRIAEAVGPNFANSRDVLMPAVQRFRSLKSFTANGVVGDPRRASRAKGEALLAACAKLLGDTIADPATWKGPDHG